MEGGGGGGGGWELNPEARQRIVAKMVKHLNTALQVDLTEGLIDLQRLAARVECRTYSQALNQSDYLRRISLRMLYWESNLPSKLVHPPQLVLCPQEHSHRLEVHHNDFKEHLIDRDPSRSRKRLCEDDRLSDLPDTMLHHIMSLLSAEEVARTCVLSRRWRMLWTSTPCLDLDIDQFGNDRVRFSKFVDHFLLSRAPASLDTFHLHSFAVDRACSWIDHAVTHNVRMLEFKEKLGWEPLYLDPQLMGFTSRFLKHLKLTYVTLDTNVFEPLNHACPALEKLQLIESFFDVPEICSNSLKDLDIIDCSLSKDLVIRTPKLISLHFENSQVKYDPFKISSELSNIELSSSVTLCGLANVRSIELSSSVREVRFSTETPRCPMFGNLTNLCLGECCLSDNCSPLVCFLGQSPVLEKLTLKLQVEQFKMKEMNAVCLHRRRSYSSEHLKKATIFCRRGDARVVVLTTMLRANAKSLDQVDIRHY